MRASSYLRRQGAVVSLLALTLALLPLFGVQAKKPRPPVLSDPVPAAECGPGDRVETGLQGQTTIQERESGASEEAYNCNLELVGQYQGEGANWQLDWFDDCAYYGTLPRPENPNPGVVVLDVSDPTNPTPTARLTEAAMLNPHESLKVNQRRRLLAGVEEGGPGFALYDVSGDCRDPELLADIELEGSVGHAGDFTPDGMTYYATQTFRGFQGIMPIVDLSDPSNPQHLLNWQFPGQGRPHDVNFNRAGTRLYSPQPGILGNTASSIGPNGLVILDTSDIQARRPNPRIPVVSTLFWGDGGQAQDAFPVFYSGRPYLIFTDESGSGGGSGAERRRSACDQGLPTDGFARIIDISDERNPVTASKLMLEVQDPANCALTVDDPVTGLRYSSHYCGVDRVQDPRLLACTYSEAGLRVFDIRDPYRPREVAYYKSPAMRTAFLPGSTRWGPDADRTADAASTQTRFVRYRGETHIWFVSQDNGFQVVRLADDVLKKGKGKKRGGRGR